MEDDRRGNHGLSQRQQQLYEFIRSRIRQRGYAPTVREMAAAFGIRSPNGVMYHLRALERVQLIRRHRKIPRAIELVQERAAGANLPLAGAIAAGRPLEAVQQPESLDLSDLVDDPELFALQVRGDSMVEDQIVDGDYVIVRRQQTAENGQIVVALVDGGEATLKRFYRDGGRVRLEPANSRMRPIYPDQVQVLGVVVGVVRKLAP